MRPSVAVDLLDQPLADVLRSIIGAAYGEVRLVDDPDMTPAARLARLEALDDVLAHGRADIADARATVIAEAATVSSTAKLAAELGLSKSAVAKAVARRRKLDASQSSDAAGGTVSAM